jgi:hypothetical protein
MPKKRKAKIITPSDSPADLSPSSTVVVAAKKIKTSHSQPKGTVEDAARTLLKFGLFHSNGYSLANALGILQDAPEEQLRILYACVMKWKANSMTKIPDLEAKVITEKLVITFPNTPQFDKVDDLGQWVTTLLQQRIEALGIALDSVKKLPDPIRRIIGGYASFYQDAPSLEDSSQTQGNSIGSHRKSAKDSDRTPPVSKSTPVILDRASKKV